MRRERMTTVSATASASAGANAGEPTVLYLIGRIDRVVRRAIAEVVRPHSLSVNQYVTLSVLDRRDGLSNAQLARRALVSPQAMNEVLLTLEDQGLVRRRAHPAHGRIRPTRLTAKGRKLLARCDVEVADIEARLLCGLSTRERAELRAVLVRGIRSLRGGGDAAEAAGAAETAAESMAE
jgi:DNA-binding MarR family transcriptional regulator